MSHDQGLAFLAFVVRCAWYVKLVSPWWVLPAGEGTVRPVWASCKAHLTCALCSSDQTFPGVFSFPLPFIILLLPPPFPRPPPFFLVLQSFCMGSRLR